MIKVVFKDGHSKNYPIRCKDMYYTVNNKHYPIKSWESVDYKWAFEPIAHIIEVDVNTIESWRVL